MGYLRLCEVETVSLYTGSMEGLGQAAWLPSCLQTCSHIPALRLGVCLPVHSCCGFSTSLLGEVPWGQGIGVGAGQSLLLGRDQRGLRRWMLKSVWG